MLTGDRNSPKENYYHDGLNDTFTNIHDDISSLVENEGVWSLVIGKSSSLKFEGRHWYNIYVWKKGLISQETAQSFFPETEILVKNP